jgi:hypothetical protein
MLLEMSTHAFGGIIIQNSKIHNLFIWYPNNTYFSVLNPFENGVDP